VAVNGHVAGKILMPDRNGMNAAGDGVGLAQRSHGESRS